MCWNCFFIIRWDWFVILTSNVVASTFRSRGGSQQNISVWALPHYWNITWDIFSFNDHAENEVGKLVPDLFAFEKALCQVKASGQPLSDNKFSYSFILTYNKTTYAKFRVVDPWYSQIWFFRKGNGTSFSTTFCKEL